MSESDYKLKVWLEVENQIDQGKIKKELEKTWEQAWEWIAQGLWRKKQSRLDKIISFGKDGKKELDKSMVAQLKMDLAQYKKDLSLAKKEYIMFAREGNEELKKSAKKAIDDLTANIKKAKSDIKENWGRIDEWLGGLGSSFWKIALAWTAIAVTTELGKKAIELWSNLQQAQISFETMLWSWEQAQALLSELSKFASKTPFELTWIRENAKQLLAMWISADDMIPTLKALGDVSAWLNVPLERLALNYWQVITQGKLTGKELKDFTAAGVPLADELAKNLWKSKSEIQNLASQGKISADDMIKAFESMTSEWGKFANLMEKQANTLGGQRSNMIDQLEWIWEKIGLAVLPTLQDMINDTSEGIEEFNEMWWAGITAGEMIAHAFATIVNATRIVLKSLTSLVNIIAMGLASAITVASSAFSDLWNGAKYIAANLGQAFNIAGNNLKYGLMNGINSAIWGLNSFLSWIKNKFNVDLGRIGTLDAGKYQDFFAWEDPFKNTKNAREWTKEMLSNDRNKLGNERTDMLSGMNEGYENIWKTFKKSNAELKKDMKKTLDKIKDDNESWWKSLLERKKEELRKMRDLEIEAVQNSTASEFEKQAKLYDIKKEYEKKELALEGKTNDELLKTAEQFLKDYYDKKLKTSQDEQKFANDAIKKADDYKKSLDKISKTWEDMKEKASDTLRTVNHELASLDEDFWKDLGARYAEISKQLASWDGEYDEKIKLEEELLLIEQKTTAEQREQARLLSEQSETQKIIAKYEEERAQKKEYQNILQAVAWAGDVIDQKLIEITDTEVKYWDEKKWEYVAITDFKNQEYARDLYNQQLKLQTEYQETKKNYNDQIKLIEMHSKNVLNQWQSDTKAYKMELDKRKLAVQQYVADVQRMLSSIPSAHRAFGGELSNGKVALVGEHGPEQIIARASSYVQPRNAITNHSVVNTTTSQNYNLNMGDAHFWPFATVDDLLAALKSKLTYHF